MFYKRPPKRQVKRQVRQPAKPIKEQRRGPLRPIQNFFLSFTPSRFKSYWISKAGLFRILAFFGILLLFVILVFLWYAKDLPSPSKINARISQQTTKFYDRTNTKLLYELYGDQNRSIIAFDQMPKTIKQATIAIEDKDFYNHGAFSIFGIGRALTGVITGVNKGGGSTITQQYVKNTLLTNERSYSRKIKELILSIEIEWYYSKDTILKMYLNEISYSNQAYGIESACKTYFPMDIDKADVDQHCAKNLNLSQAALLASIPNLPTYYNPYGAHQDALIERQHIILNLMAEQKYITAAEAKAAYWTVADLSDSTKISQVRNLYGSLDPRLAHFVLYAKDYVANEFTESTATEGGLRVITTLDYDKQMAAYDAVQSNMANIRSSGGSNAAMTVTDPKSGQILAMIGSHDFNDANGGQLNVAVNGQRQPGSSFKPIVYATLLGTNKDAACAKDRTCPTYGPGTTLYDAPTNFGSPTNKYEPQNFGGKSYGITTVRGAIAGSLNIPAVKALYMAGVDNSLDTAKALGITTLTQTAADYGLSLVLGSGSVTLAQMTSAYESFANGGQHYKQTPILKVTDANGKIMEDNSTPAKPKQVLDPQVAYLIADMLSDNNAKRYVFANDLDIKHGCGNNQSTGCIHSGSKTGTTEHYNDAWTIGFTPDIVAGVWVGNNDNAPMQLAAADIAAPLWKTFMNAIYSDAGKTSTDAFAKPAGIKSVTLDKQTGRAATDKTTDKTTDLFPSWYVPMSATSGKSATIDKLSKKLATNCTPELARDTIYSSAVVPEISATDPEYAAWLAGMVSKNIATSGAVIPTESDDLHSCSDIKPMVQIDSVLQQDSLGYIVTVTATLGTFGTDKAPGSQAQLQVYLDDQLISTQQITASGDYSISSSPTVDTHTYKVVITDSGLYQSSDNKVVTTSAVPVSTSPSPSASATPHAALPISSSRPSRKALAQN
jgi:penicillin-binding protein 1A